MPSPDTESSAYTVTKDAIINWLARLLITVGGLAFGLWAQSLDGRLDKLDTDHLKRFDSIDEQQRAQRKILEERAYLPPKVGELERQTQDQEQRLRAAEKQIWKRER